MDVLWHYCYTLSVGGTQVSILKEAYQMVVYSLMQCLVGVHLKVQVVSPMCLGNCMHQVCNRLLADEELGAPLVLCDLAESHHP